MVGGQGGPGPAADRLSPAVRAAYDLAAAGWDAGPGPLYADLARALLAQPGLPVAGRRVLDVGAGTGAAGLAALAAGAVSVVAADIAPGMLRRCPAALHPVAASATALPFADQSFDLAVAAFCLGHLDSIPDCLRELRRTCAAIAVSAFAPGWNHPAKSTVDDVLAAFGYRPPAWYLAFKEQREPRAAAASELHAEAARAGFADVRVSTVTVRTPLAAPAQLTSWRLGMAHVAPFAASLDPARRVALQREAEAALRAADCGPLVVAMLVLTASRSG
jgi:ubiquinone/menaquinone biosynthesis C-methylase UbiE